MQKTIYYACGIQNLLKEIDQDAKRPTCSQRDLHADTRDEETIGDAWGIQNLSKEMDRDTKRPIC